MGVGKGVKSASARALLQESVAESGALAHVAKAIKHKKGETIVVASPSKASAFQCMSPC